MSILPDGDGEEFSIDSSTKEPRSEGGLLKDGICPQGTGTGWCAGYDDETLSETMKGDKSIVSDKADDEACSSSSSVMCVSSEVTCSISTTTQQVSAVWRSQQD